MAAIKSLPTNFAYIYPVQNCVYDIAEILLRLALNTI